MAANPTNGGDHNARITRIEEFLEVITAHQMAFVDEHRRLLTAQVLLTERMEQLAEAQRQTAEAQRHTAEAQRHTDERMNALIQVVDGLIKRGGNEGLKI